MPPKANAQSQHTAAQRPCQPFAVTEKEKNMKRLINNRTSSQLMLALLAIAIFLLQIGCKKDETEISQNLIAEGCIPEIVNLDEPLLGGYNDVYKYENGKLIGFGSYNYEYQNGVVKKIRLGQDRYEEYIYDDDNKVIQSIQYRRDDPAEGFKVVSNMKYEYNDSLIVKVFDNDEELIHEISYYSNTNNIDSIKTFNSNLELVEVDIFEYDQSNNVFKNLLMPKFNFFWWIEKNSNNNVTQRKILKLSTPINTIIYNYTLKYNSYNFPIEINGSRVNSSFTTKTIISYIGCK